MVSSIAVTSGRVGGDIAVTGSHDGSTCVWGLPDGSSPHGGVQVLQQLVAASSSSIVTSVAVTGNGTHAVTGHYDGSLSVWDTQTWRLVQVLGGVGSKQHHTHTPVTGVTVTSDDKQPLVIASHADGHIHVSWDVTPEFCKFRACVASCVVSFPLLCSSCRQPGCVLQAYTQGKAQFACWSAGTLHRCGNHETDNRAKINQNAACNRLCYSMNIIML